MPFISISKNITVNSENITSVSFDENKNLVCVTFKKPIYLVHTNQEHSYITIGNFISEKEARERMEQILTLLNGP